MSTRLRRAVMAAFTCLTALANVDPVSAKRGGQEPLPVGPQATLRGIPTLTITIGPRDRTIIRQYFGQRLASGDCPPGLAEKSSGCLPPGPAKTWVRRQPLPAGIPYYMLPRELLVQLAPPPAACQYIRVADDVLLMATGTRVILDAVRDLARL